METKTNNPWNLAWSKWWVQQNYKKCEVDEMTLSEIYELLEQKSNLCLASGY